MTITAVRITPIAFRDPPLLNVVGIHERYALRSIVEVETADGLVGLGETYGDSAMIEGLQVVGDALIGLDPFDLAGLRRQVRGRLRPGGDEGLAIAPGTLRRNLPSKVEAAYEVAFLDLQGQLLGRPLVDLLGGPVRERVPFSAYLFYKLGRHRDAAPGDDDAWGEALDPEAIVAQARRMRREHGFASIKLKAGVLEPEREAATLLALADAFPGLPLRIDPNGGWTVETSVRMARELAAVLEYLEDPTPGLAGMAEVARQTETPLATNMVITAFEHLPEALPVPSGPGLGVRLDRDALARQHETYLRCGICDRDDVAEMRRYRPGWTGALPRF
ncbi:MAG: enolase C-terminal domain-like protein [Trueperaceae bacterium]